MNIAHGDYQSKLILVPNNNANIIPPVMYTILDTSSILFRTSANTAVNIKCWVKKVLKLFITFQENNICMPHKMQRKVGMGECYEILHLLYELTIVQYWKSLLTL